MATRYGWDSDVSHHLSQVMPQEQALDLIASLKREVTHEAAEKIRKLSSEEYNHPKLFVCQDALNRAVNLIDPYVKGE